MTNVSKTKKTIKTRNSFLNNVFGALSPLPRNVLPTDRDVGKYYLYVKDKRSTSKVDIYKTIGLEVQEIWKLAFITTMGVRSPYFIACL